MGSQTTDRQFAGSKPLAEVAMGCFGYFIVMLVLLHGLRPDYTPVDHMISDYAVGRLGWVMTTAFVALAVGCLTLGLGMALAGPKALPGRAAVLLL
jgi:hypothetical protein